jgi:hypothetical protein
MFLDLRHAQERGGDLTYLADLPPALAAVRRINHQTLAAAIANDRMAAGVEARGPAAAAGIIAERCQENPGAGSDAF